MKFMRDLVQKALYLGVGLAAYAAEKAGSNLQELKTQAQKLAEELVERGEMNMEEAKRYVDDLMQEAQSGVENKSGNEPPREPRRIEIVDDDEGNISPSSPSSSSTAPSTPSSSDPDALRKQVAALQAELERLRRST
ncbi:MAG: phasin family protein [Microcystaceae cyanobacterium]